MNKLTQTLIAVFTLAAMSACGRQDAAPQAADPAPQAVAAEPVAARQDPASAMPEGEDSTLLENVSESQGAPQTPPETQKTGPTVQPSVRLGNQVSGQPTSGRFKEGTNYQRLVPAQPTSVEPGQVEAIEVFWYGCGHCFALDPAVESWNRKDKAPYVQFVQLPAMWNEVTRMHARMFYTAEVLGKLEEMHADIFREIHVNANPLNSADQISALFQKHGIKSEDFEKTFSSFAVESKLQRADLLNRRYRVQSVPMFIVNGKYTTDISSAGSEQALFALLDELAAHEHGG